MADNPWTNNPFSKMCGELNLPNSPMLAPMREMAAQYIDNSEKWANQALEMSEKTTAWAKETPMAPMFEAQLSLAKQVIGSSTMLARQLWQLDKPAEEEASV